MNIVVICLDSFRQDHVGFYHQGRPAFAGVPACRTPNLDAFARESVAFDNVYPCGLPTLPVRTELMTGQFTLPYRPWQPLVSSDLTAAEILRRNGYTCALVSDTYHFRAPGMNYHRGFHVYRWIRGQEYDPYVSHRPRRRVDDYVNKHYSEIWRNRVAQYLANTDDFTEERHWYCARVVEQACDWLVRNRGRKVFLWVDSFEPHEPWDPPERFDVYTDPAYRGPRLVMPLGGMASDWATPDEARLVQGLYAGAAAFVDHCLGPLFECLRDRGYYDDTVVVLLADHGHPLGDHGKFLKGTDRMYSELLEVPFFVRMPGAAPRRTAAIGQFPDVLPTVFELAGLAAETGSMAGRSFARVLRGETDVHRDVAIAGYFEGRERCIRDAGWSCIMGSEDSVDELYDLVSDPAERRNLVRERPEEARRLASQFGRTWHREAQSSYLVSVIQGRYELGSAGIR